MVQGVGLKWIAVTVAAIPAILLPAPSASHGAVDFGDNLVGAATSDFFCGPQCSVWQVALHPANIAGTLSSPMDGVVVRWAVKTEPVPPSTAMRPVHPRVIRPVGTLWQALGAGADVVPAAAGGFQEFPTRLPIGKGDHLGIEYSTGTPGAVYMFANNVFGATLKLRAPPFPQGGPPESNDSNINWRLLMRGTIEPDADGDGFGDETQDKCPTQAGANAGCKPKKCKRKKKRKGKTAAAKKKGCKKKGKKRR